MKKAQYENSSQAIISLASKIEKGKATKWMVEKELKHIKNNFKSPFLPTMYERKPKPWNKDYLKQLRGSVAFGKSSTEFFLYFTEVADHVYRPRRIIKAIATMIALVAIIITIIAIMDLHPGIIKVNISKVNTHLGGII